MHRIGAKDCVHAWNARAYAIGKQTNYGFRVRRIVWGRLMAKSERMAGEEVRRSVVLVEKTRK
jgi:hypothetical protein